MLNLTKSLSGLNRDKPYSFIVTASDNGIPKLSSTTRLLIHVNEAVLTSDFDSQTLRIIKPSVEAFLEIPEVKNFFYL